MDLVAFFVLFFHGSLTFSGMKTANILFKV